ncbi:MAG TPA: peptide-methionine (S)-S-oxide reductase MsrA [Thermodesulfobacteriota bacterium]|nr:peptide-methionine (S)-S-oxide reductase MsrA [Candidatus Paceibacterota bacterium]HVY55337.1 peptide-methionine (S)-S-oxide reductase MsrA [Thermodesulfobacteriota bacterium]
MAERDAIYEKAVFANGCFWCTEAVFSMLKGVISVKPGYTGGTKVDPTYDEVSTGRTGHAEAIEIEYDPSAVSYDDLLAVFFNTHDPTTLNRQGADVGTQYRSAIFYADDRQRQKAAGLIKELNDARAYDKPVVTDIRPLDTFYEAEDYHHDYYKNNKSAPYCQIVIAPKLEKFQKRFEKLLK